MKNYYELLGVSITATSGEISRAMKRAAEQQHLDLETLTACRDNLLNAEARQAYNRELFMACPELLEEVQQVAEEKVEPTKNNNKESVKDQTNNHLQHMPPKVDTLGGFLKSKMHWGIKYIYGFVVLVCILLHRNYVNDQGSIIDESAVTVLFLLLIVVPLIYAKYWHGRIADFPKKFSHASFFDIYVPSLFSFIKFSLYQWVFVWVIGMVLTVAGGGSLSNTPQEPNPSMAQHMCEEAIKNRLKSPSQAAFNEVRVMKNETGIFVVKGVVDAPNSFGVKMRDSFKCFMTPSGNSFTIDQVIL